MSERDPIRRLDAGDIAPLSSRLAALPLLVRYRRDADALARDLAAGLARGEELWVLDEGDGAVGLSWSLAAGSFAMGGYLKLLAVASQHAGRGAGGRLLAAFERATAAASAHAFLLVSDFNHEAQRFYERHGYSRVGSLPRLVLPEVDEVIYWKRLR